MDDPIHRPYYFLSTVARAMDVLDQFIGLDAELGVTEIARRLAIHKSVAHRLVATLTDLGMLANGSTDGTYRLGTKSLELGLSYLRHSPIDRIAQAHLIGLAQRYPDLAFHVAILDGTEIVYQKSIAGPAAAKWLSPHTLGRRQQAYCTSLGKVLLAYLSPSELDNYLGRVQLRPFTPRTITSTEALRAELEVVRSQGWAYDNREFHSENCCLGAPIRDHSGRVMAALSIVALVDDMDKYGKDVLVAAVRDTASAISHDLGFWRDRS
jgi:IclR family transcriptional regulator, pca regulon regulatory protein